MRNTKILCTLGPAVDSEEGIRALILGGMNGARFNFSHGTHESQLATFRRFQKVRAELGIPVAAVLDTKGPEIRVKSFTGGAAELQAGTSFTLTSREIEGNASGVSVTYEKLAQELHGGERVLIDDGLVELRVERIEGQDVICTVINGGRLSDHKSINLPDTHIHLPAVTEKDRSDLRFAAQHGFDYIAASFIRSAGDVAAVRAVLEENGASGIRIIAKVENREGVEHLDEILNAADGVMVARGDLGVEIPACEVPVVQKEMVRRAVRRGKPVIIATQMLDSMIRNPRPTRAEISDVANAIFDDASCVMLSGETASGKYPLEALRTMVETVEAAEASLDRWARLGREQGEENDSINEAITHACCTTAKDLRAAAILTVTKTGHTARMISRFRPGCPILALTPDERVQRQLALSWGVEPIRVKEAGSTDELLRNSVERVRECGCVNDGDTVVITAGIPIGGTGSTNLIKAQIIGESVS